MSVCIGEQETTISISREDGIARIWTSDATMITKLDKLAKNSSEWDVTGQGVIDGKIVDKEYACPKKLISFRFGTKKKTMTDAQKQAFSARMSKMREKSKKSS